jgi:hypothetical protein
VLRLAVSSLRAADIGGGRRAIGAAPCILVSASCHCRSAPPTPKSGHARCSTLPSRGPAPASRVRPLMSNVRRHDASE